MYNFYVSCSDEDNMFHEIHIRADSVRDVLNIIENEYWGISHIWEIHVHGEWGVYPS